MGWVPHMPSCWRISPAGDRVMRCACQLEPELLEQRQYLAGGSGAVALGQPGGALSVLLIRYRKIAKLCVARLHAWLSLWRDVMLEGSGANAPVSNLDYHAEIESLARQCDLSAAHRIVAAVDRTLNLLEHNVNARLATEVLMLDLPRR